MKPLVIAVAATFVLAGVGLATPDHADKRLGLRPDFYEDTEIFCDCLGMIPYWDTLDCGYGRHPWRISSCGYQCQECPLPPGTPICEGLGLMPIEGDPPDCGTDRLVTVSVGSNPSVQCWKCIPFSCGCLLPPALLPTAAQTWGRLKATYR